MVEKEKDIVFRLRTRMISQLGPEDLDEAADEIERLRSAGWAPIETAPKDGKQILVVEYGPTYATYSVIWWGDKNEAEEVPHEEFWCWLVSDRKHDPFHFRGHPTHWMFPPEVSND